ncbi:ATP-binding protein [Desulfatirhabdium butyrativorans]|uniref:ATP-binding protein n=1 Tax=Desulfatirhabdium butyrativorans TaxID=340467 RepID=UPI0003F76EC1|nr:ATP-binding protein [Desulfatirhabdium butyrativorans]
MKKLPIGIQSFVKMRQGNFYYVDKTAMVAELVNKGGGYYFLSRPRRFGKSLFLDTLRQAFFARKELFSGLYLENNWDWDTRYPVIHISFGSGVIQDIEDLGERFAYILKINAENGDVMLLEQNLRERFFELIRALYTRHHQPVVILIDEYDKPILDHIDKPQMAVEIREGLKNFYSVIKDSDEFLKFVFITGVSKFSKVSLFSGLNNLQDITLDPMAATVCGYTHEELIHTFAERLDGVNLEEVRRWYDGYNFLGDRVYNPFDILLFLDTKEFRNYWFETGSPSFLIKLITERQYPAPDIETIEASEAILSSFDIDDIQLDTLLFQTGYLTIKDWAVLGSDRLYTLVYPNLEVKKSLTEHLLRYLTNSTAEQTRNRIRLYRCLEAADLDQLRDIFHAFFASIPYEWYRKNESSRYEGYYASIFYCYFTALGLDVTAEQMTNKGRIDMAVRLGGRVFILEFKVVEIDGSAHTALDQIRKMRYWERYRGQADAIFLIGVEFSSADRNIVGFEWERIQTDVSSPC